MTLLPHALLRSCILFCILSTATANPAPNNSSASSALGSLSSEELHYVVLECESFAKKDNVSQDHHSNYIKTCIDELGAAVKNAIDKLHTKSGPATAKE